MPHKTTPSFANPLYQEAGSILAAVQIL